MAADIRGRIKSVRSDRPQPRQLFPIDRNLHNYPGTFSIFFSSGGSFGESVVSAADLGLRSPPPHPVPPPGLEHSVAG